MTHQEKMIKQDKHGEELLIRSKEVLAEGKKVIKGDVNERDKV